MPLVHDKDMNDAVYSLIQDSSHNLTLVTPYFDPADRLLLFIERAVDRGAKVTLLVRDIREEPNTNLSETTKSKLQRMQAKGVRVQWLPWLHAKIYVSENRAIISSLNLLSTSFELSHETGVLFTSASPEHAGVIARVEDLCRKASVYVESVCPAKRRAEIQPPPSPAAAAVSVAAPATASTAAHVAAYSPYAQVVPSTLPPQPFSPPPVPRPPFRPDANPHPFVSAVAAVSAAVYSAAAAAAAGGGGGRASAAKRPSSPAITGFCVKCRAECPLKRQIAPFCRSCYICDDQAKGEFCHVCGKSDYPKTLHYPLCGGCYKSRKSDFNFIVN